MMNTKQLNVQWTVNPIQLNQVCTADGSREVAFINPIGVPPDETISIARLIATAPRMSSALQRAAYLLAELPKEQQTAQMIALRQEIVDTIKQGTPEYYGLQREMTRLNTSESTWPYSEHVQPSDLSLYVDEFRRMKACWNACEGIPTPDLEVDNARFAEMLRERITLRDQRDELLAELAVARSALADFAGLTEPHAHSLARRFAEDIAKVKGGAA